METTDKNGYRILYDYYYILSDADILSSEEDVIKFSSGEKFIKIYKKFKSKVSDIYLLVELKSIS